MLKRTLHRFVSPGRSRNTSKETRIRTGLMGHKAQRQSFYYFEKRFSWKKSTINSTGRPNLDVILTRKSTSRVICLRSCFPNLLQRFHVFGQDGSIFFPTHLYSWVERGTVRVKLLAKNTTQRRTRTSRSVEKSFIPERLWILYQVAKEQIKPCRCVFRVITFVLHWNGQH